MQLTQEEQNKFLPIIEDAWRITPCRVAEKLSKNKFIRYPHIRYISRTIAREVSKGNARIVISMPPRHGKSWLTSLWTPTWYLGLEPDKNIILASYEADFASHWGRNVRNLISEHQETLGVRLTEDSTAANRWNTPEGGGMVTAGVGGPITGRGGHLMIIDDPVKNYEDAMSALKRERNIDWFNSTFYTRAEPGASMIVLMTRWHERDLAGYLLKEHEDDWTEIKLPALAEENDLLGRPLGGALCPERYDNEALHKISKAVGTKVWNALYQQRPSAEEGNIIRRDWLRFHNGCTTYDELIQSWDMTFTGKATSDFVVGTVWARHGSQKFLLDRVKARIGINETIEAFIKLSEKWPSSLVKLIENKANGPAVEDLLKKRISGIILWEPQGDKVSRANAVAPQFEAGNVFLPDPIMNPWINDYIESLVNFPNAEHDDDVDSTTMALLRLEESVSKTIGKMRMIRR